MRDFLQACDSALQLDLEIEALGIGVTRFRLQQPYAVVGRHPDADLQLDGDTVRPRHLYLQMIEGRLFAINVSHTGQAWWDGEVKPHGWIDPGNRVQVGAYFLSLAAHETRFGGTAISNPLAAGSAWDIFAPRVKLEIVDKDTLAKPKSWTIDRLLTLIGGAPMCDLRLLDQSISNVHASLVLTPDGLWAVDLLGRGGIFINQQPMRMGKLNDGSELQIGCFVCKVSYEQPAAVAQQRMEVDNQVNDLRYDLRYDESAFQSIEDAFDLPSPSMVKRYQNIHQSMFVNYQQLLHDLMEKFGAKEPLYQELLQLEKLHAEAETLLQSWEEDQKLAPLASDDTVEAIEALSTDTLKDKVVGD
jgi:predicted component of type VI protein secretion system